MGSSFCLSINPFTRPSIVPPPIPKKLGGPQSAFENLKRVAVGLKEPQRVSGLQIYTLSLNLHISGSLAKGIAAH